MDIDPEKLKAVLLACLTDKDVMDALTCSLKGELKKRDEEIASLKEKVREQEQALNELEQYSRRNILNVSGLPEKPNEAPVKVAIDLVKSIGVTLQSSDIDRAHRIGRRQGPASEGGKARPLLIKFVSYQKRDEVWSARKKLMETGTKTRSSQNTPALKVFISENFTRRNQKLMYTARQLRNEGKLYAVWSDGCVMKTRKSETSPTRVFRTEADLEAIAGVASSATTAASDASTSNAAGGGGWRTAK